MPVMSRRLRNTSMEITACTGEVEDRWNGYVQRQANCCHYHLFGWKRVIEDVYQHDCVYLLATERGEPVGTLPLAFVQSRLFGNSVTSLPFVDVAGAVADQPETCERLRAQAFEAAVLRRAAYLELRQAVPLAGAHRNDTEKRSLTLPLRPSEEAQWQALPPERRNRVRKAEREGLKADISGPDGLEAFYKVWCHNMRDLGSPAHSRRWFETVFSTFPDDVRVLLVRDGDSVVGAAILVVYKRTLSVPWVSSLRSAFSRHPNDLLYWESIRYAIACGCTTFDFGRSSAGSGNHAYKTRWGALDQPIHWQYWSVDGRSGRLPGRDHRSLELATRIWTWLPVAIANRLGPIVRKSITR